MSEGAYLGLDLGSVSLSLALIEGSEVRRTGYVRVGGQPVGRLFEVLCELQKAGTGELMGVCATGSGGWLISDILGIPAVNEISAHAEGALHFYPGVRTIIEIGGQDSKLILIEARQIIHSALNELCAAGTGSYLDGQGGTLGVSMEEFGDIACASRQPAPVAGRCAVFAKSDAVHERQQGRKLEDILMGICLALARAYLAGLGKGSEIMKPVVFQGGVAANSGMRKAFLDILGCPPDNLIIPRYHKEMGAIGAALKSQKISSAPLSLDVLIEKTKGAARGSRGVERKCSSMIPTWKCGASGVEGDIDLPLQSATGKDALAAFVRSSEGSFYMGLDVGSVSTCAVLIDDCGELAEGSYERTGSDPLKAVREALTYLSRFADKSRIRGAGVTGSGRRLVANLTGASAVLNEISAQARATAFFHPEADTVFEIGGQDSKFIRLRERRVLDFDMNRVCSAGTGVFLEEQMKRLGLTLSEGIDLALSSASPVELVSRCTVFIESDLVHCLSKGCRISDICAGLMLAVARNYLATCTGGKEIGRSIFFQGGVASNKAVALAFKSLLGRPVTVTRHNNLTGAIGAALAARDKPEISSWRGFEMIEAPLSSFQCDGCANCCTITKMISQDTVHFAGGRCGKWDTGHSNAEEAQESYWRKRESLLWGAHL